jgi:hypothetical protein
MLSVKRTPYRYPGKYDISTGTVRVWVVIMDYGYVLYIQYDVQYTVIYIYIYIYMAITGDKALHYSTSVAYGRSGFDPPAILYTFL